MSVPSTVSDQLAALQARNAANNTANNANPSAQPSTSAAKLAKNKRLPATMITPGGSVESSKKKGPHKLGKRQKKKVDASKEKALERSSRLQEKVKAREERKAQRTRAKNAWE